MELPDFMSYANRFSQSDFVEKISRIAKRAGAKLVYAALILYYTLQSDKVSKTDKAIIIGALGYMISPLDVIPDAIPIAGLTDDLAVLLYVASPSGSTRRRLPKSTIFSTMRRNQSYGKKEKRAPRCSLFS